MTRIRYWDYKSPDTTLLLNEEKRGILRPGVYFGYNAVPGSSGLQITLEMDTDPDKAGSKLGTIITRDAVVVQETEDLTDAATAPAAHATLPRIDLLVATYIYNASLPNNDVTYEVVQGTAAASPTPPAVTENQLILAEIHLDAAQTTLTTDDIIDVERLDLYGTAQFDVTNIIRPGVYTGYLCKEGGAVNRTSVTAGSLFTPEEVTINLTSDQTDLFTHTATTSANYYRWDWIVAMHKDDDLDPNPPDYILVEGVEADESAGSIATPPSNSDILTAAQLVDPKYDNADYINKLCLVRVQGLAGSMEKEYYHTPRLLLDTQWYVSAGTYDDSQLPVGPVAGEYFPFVGPQGLQDALDAIQALLDTFYSGAGLDVSEAGITLWIDGVFHMNPDEVVGIPSYVKVKGIGGAKIIVPGADSPAVALGGHAFLGPTGVLTTLAADQTGVPTFYERWDFSLTTAATKGDYANLTDGLKEARFSGNALAGDPVFINDNTNPLVGWFEEYDNATYGVGPFNFTLILPASMIGGGTDELVIAKRNNSLENVEIEGDGITLANDSSLCLTGCINSLVKNVVAPSVKWSLNNENTILDDLTVTPHGGWEVPDATGGIFKRGGSHYREVLVRPALDLGVTVNFEDWNAVVDKLELDYEDEASSHPAFTFYSSLISSLMIHDIDDDKPEIAGDDSAYERIVIDHPAGTGVGSIYELLVSGDYNLINFLRIDGATPGLEWTGNDNTLVKAVGTSGTFSITKPATDRNFIIAGVNDYGEAGVAAASDEDRNIQILSDAIFSWDATSGQLSFDDDIVIDFPYSNTTNVIQQASSPITLSASDTRAYVTLDRSVGGGAINVTPSTLQKSSGGTFSLINDSTFILVRRYGDRLYFSNGFVLDDGNSGSLDNAVPLDNSVTYPKLEATAKSYVNNTLEWYLDQNDSIDPDSVEPEVLFARSYLTSLGSWTWTASAGTLTVGTTITGLSNVQPGDALVDFNGNLYWILDTITGASEGFQLRAGSITPVTSGAVQVGDLNVIRGAAAYATSDSYTVAPATTYGRVDITMSTTVPASSCKPGYLFVDGNGEKFRITAVSGGTGVITVWARKAPALRGSTTLRVVRDVNPRGIPLMDLKPAYGWEVIPVSGTAVRRYATAYPYHDMEQGWMCDTKDIVPADPRVKVLGVVSDELIHPNSNSGGSTRDDPEELPLPEAGITIGSADSAYDGTLDVTAWMTGIAFSTPFGSPTLNKIYIDGAEYTDTAELSQNLTADGYFPSGTSISMLWTSSRLVNLPPGVHNIKIVSGSAEFTVRNVVIFNEENPEDNLFAQPGGRLYADMTAWDADPATVALPTFGRRGGKLIRYADVSSGSLSQGWAQTDVTVLDTTGTVNPATNSVTNIPDTSNFRVGDIIRLIDSVGVAERRRIVTVSSGTSLIIDANPTTLTAGTATVQFIGRTFLSQADTSQYDEFNHENEQEALFFPVWGGMNRRYHGQVTTNSDFMSTFLGVDNRQANLPDCSSTLMVVDGDFAWREPWLNVDNSAYATFSFIGTGLDLILMSIPTSFSEDIDVVVDGLALGTARFVSDDVGALTVGMSTGGNTFSIDWREQVRFPIVQDLDYGFHVVEFDFSGGITADTLRVLGFSVWEPKEPTFSGVKTYETNYVAQRVESGGSFVDDSSGVGSDVDVPSGFINYDPKQVMLGEIETSPGTAIFTVEPPTLNGASLLQANSPNGTYCKWDNLTATGGANDVVRNYFVFYGSAIGLDFAGTTGTTLTYAVTFLDADGSWRNPASFLGASMTVDVGSVGGIVPTAKTRTIISMDREQVYVMRLSITNTSGSTAEEFYLYQLYVWQRFHIYQREFLRDNMGWLVPRSGGRDVRPIIGERAWLPPPIKEEHWAVDIGNDIPVGAYAPSGSRAMGLLIDSDGGYYKVGFSGWVNRLATLASDDLIIALIWENGLRQNNPAGASSLDYLNVSAQQYVPCATADQKEPASAYRIMYLPPGLHLLTLNIWSSGATGTELGASEVEHNLTLTAEYMQGEGDNVSRIRRATPDFVRLLNRGS